MSASDVAAVAAAIAGSRWCGVSRTSRAATRSERLIVVIIGDAVGICDIRSGGACWQGRLQSTTCRAMSQSLARRDRPLPLSLSSPTSPRRASLDHDSIYRPPRPSRDYPLSSPPTTSSFHISAIPAASPPSHTATHAGGILPSASFFRPSRPPHSRPSSPSSHSHSHSHPPPDSFALSPIKAHPSQDSDLRRISDSPSLRRLTSQLKRSREPLLPFATTLPPFSPPSKPSDFPPPSDMRPNRLFCSGITRIWSKLSLESGRNVVPSFTTRESLHRSHSVHDTSQSSHPLPHQSMFHPLVQIHPSRPPSSSPSPNNIFISDPPKTFPPLSAIPSTPRKRIHQLYPSRNRFFCAGLLLTGGDSPWAFIASLALVIAISATWFSTTCVWWWRNESPAVAAVGAYMCLLTVSCMLATVSTFRLFRS